MRLRGDILERLYSRLNRRTHVHPDPLELLYRYRNPRDREIAALVASALAYGRVDGIVKSASLVLDRLPRPADVLSTMPEKDIPRMFPGFRHRFTDGCEISSLLVGARRMIEEHGSLEQGFLRGYRGEHDTVVPALLAFSTALRSASGSGCATLIPAPDKGSAMKRLCLFLRWMVRSDDVDPGGWTRIPVSKLVVPLDTHMHRIGGALGLTRRKQADMRTAVEITRGFARFRPEDPVRYDFALTRLGIHGTLVGAMTRRSVMAALEEA